MPEMTVPRPVLRSFRVLASNGQNRGEAAGANMRLEVQQEIEVGLAVPDVAGAPLMLGVRVKLDAKATNENDTSDVATYAGEYEARFYYAAGVAEAGMGCWKTLTLPEVAPQFAPILYSVPAQLLAYHTAIAKGTDVDQPRNLAKSVTVE